jgi:hypothetical protein
MRVFAMARYKRHSISKIGPGPCDPIQRSKMKGVYRWNKNAYFAQQDSINAATRGFRSLGISSLLPLKPTAATTCKIVSRQIKVNTIWYAPLQVHNVSG